MGLADMLKIQPGVTAVIGGGGKTTLLRVLGKELAQEHRVLLCTTTKMFPFPDVPCAHSKEEIETLRQQYSLLCAGQPVPDTGKLTAPEVPMDWLAERFDYVLVEADGSAQRPMKAHAPHEPVIPAESNQVICVVGAVGFGRPITEAAHRPERYAELAGVPLEALVTPEAAAQVLLTEKLHDRVFVNQVESLGTRCAAERLADLLGCAVVGGSLQRGEYFKCW